MLKRKEVDEGLVEHTKKLAKQRDVYEAIQEAKAILKKQQDKAKLAKSKSKLMEEHAIALSKVDIETNKFIDNAEQQTVRSIGKVS